MKCLVTICSKKKDESKELLPAHLRYVAPHVSQIYEKAASLELPFYILSGKFGLISGEALIPNYDYYLEDSWVEELSTLMAKQIRKNAITEIIFYGEDKATWKPYVSAIEKATKKAKCGLHKENLSEISPEIK